MTWISLPRGLVADNIAKEGHEFGGGVSDGGLTEDLTGFGVEGAIQ